MVGYNIGVNFHINANYFSPAARNRRDLPCDAIWTKARIRWRPVRGDVLGGCESSGGVRRAR
jgi:hypothetical protein